MLDLLVFFPVLLCGAAADARIDPVPRPILTESLKLWTFDEGDEGWRAEHDCGASADAGRLRVRSDGDDPYLHCPVDLPGGELLLRIKARSQTGGGGEIFWTSTAAPRRSPKQAARFELVHDGRWREYAVRLSVPGNLTDLRLDPGAAPGTFEIESIELLRAEPHPITIEQIEVLPDRIKYAVRNHRAGPLKFSIGDKTNTVDGGATLQMEHPLAANHPLEAATIALRCDGLPPVSRTLFVHHSNRETDWIERPVDGGTIRVARDGSLARIESGGRLAALLGPIVLCGGKVPELKLVDDGPVIRFRGKGVTLSITTADEGLSVAIIAERSCEGPVVRVPGGILPGGIEQGLFAGVEYLGRHERSSSKLDVETDEHIRFAPDPMKVTMPLMAVRTDRATVAVTWADMSLQPVFAVPNFFDCTDDSRMSLRGKRIDATVRIDRGTLEEAILWTVGRRGLPPPPEPPRTRKEQWQLCLDALNGPLRNEDGWGHCVEERWQRRPFDAMPSTIWRISGEVPEVPRLVPGGSHVPNGSIWFVTGRAAAWLDYQRQQVKRHLDRQRPDGSFRYDGKYARGHFEDTASGFCATPAARLLEHAWATGDRAALEGGVRTLEFMKRFRTPRGAQTWEVPLHTPDLLASAYLTWAYVRGWELTGNEEYLHLARKWATTGIPFVYLWSCRPMMLYATTPVLGATNWVAPNWIGMPVQWVGYVYAFALVKLAPHDDSFDWNRLARGILISAEQQQYPDGEYRGCLPDAIELDTQRRRPWTINPCSMVSLRLALEGELDFLSVAADEHHRIASPLPVTIRDATAHILGQPGLEYQVIIDGSRIVDVKSKGHDVVPLR